MACVVNSTARGDVLQVKWTRNVCVFRMCHFCCDAIYFSANVTVYTAALNLLDTMLIIKTGRDPDMVRKIRGGTGASPSGCCAARGRGAHPTAVSRFKFQLFPDLSFC